MQLDTAGAAAARAAADEGATAQHPLTEQTLPAARQRLSDLLTSRVRAEIIAPTLSAKSVSAYVPVKSVQPSSTAWTPSSSLITSSVLETALAKSCFWPGELSR
jgi:hypothetical protein